MERIGWRVLACTVLINCTVFNQARPDDKAIRNWTSGRNGTTRLLPVNRQALEVHRKQEDGDVNQVVQNGGRQTGSPVMEGRTFGHKRVQFMLLPMMYKMGVMMTMIGVLTVISLKSLLIGVILLMLKFSGFLAKLQTGWQGSHPSAWPAHPQPVHVHLHSPGGHPAHAQAYNAWEPPSSPGDDEHYYYKG
ncbi:uncharacterized protein LOC105696221 [Orussus abietinus]|uniref:uncharacterized protein LOC105696221 n=1 Tax=Orussus abietinus TaxID=222816 RepID=UPI00062646B7|nr:uncharacterized protein LOC105696221 [Orussus abietinus]